MNTTCIFALIAIGLVPGLGAGAYAGLYASKIRASRPQGERPGEQPPPPALALLTRFSPETQIRIKDVPPLRSATAAFGRRPSCIVLSNELFDWDPGSTHRFSPEDVMSAVAHELGHVLSRNLLCWLFWVPASAVYGLSLLIIITELPWFAHWSGLLAPCLGHLLCWCLFTGAASAILMCKESREEEYRADLFAQFVTGIPAGSMVRLLEKLQQAPARTQGWRDRLYSVAHRLTHPTLEERIHRLQTLAAQAHQTHLLPDAADPTGR